MAVGREYPDSGAIPSTSGPYRRSGHLKVYGTSLHNPVAFRRSLKRRSDVRRWCERRLQPSGEAPHGTSLLPADLTEDQLAAAPVLVSVDALLIEELSEDEDEASDLFK